MPQSTPSRAKSISRGVAIRRISNSGRSAWKRPSRPASQLAAIEGVVLIVSVPPQQRSRTRSTPAVELVERAPHRGHQQLALVGQQQAPVEPAEQQHPQMLLQRPDLMADRGLGHVQLAGGPGEAQMARRGLEGAQRRERRQALGHGSSPA